jgi:murein DD-endopeptidase MepM/ murein hydrolase activator NlpD
MKSVTPAWQSFSNGRSRAAALFICLALAPIMISPAFAKASRTSSTLDCALVSPDTKARMSQIEEKMREFHERAAQAKKKEQIVRSHIKTIETKLNVTTGALNVKKHELKKTENRLQEVKQHIDKTRSDEVTLTTDAAQRLREIYEGQRLGFLEMFFEASSLQVFLDKCYFQERVAELDRSVLNDLRAKTAALVQHKDTLGQEKNKLGDMVSEFARKAMAIAKEKFDQEQVANRLRTQRAFYEQAERQLANESHRLETQILEMESSRRRGKKGMSMGSGKMAMPIVAQVTSPFGWRTHPIFGVRRFHTGIDLAGPNHSAIRAADSGNVLYTGWYGGYGKVVIVSHGNGMATLYAHLCKIAANPGDNVTKGDVIGYEGTTGFSTGPHLHFETRVNGVPNNPINYLK